MSAEFILLLATSALLLVQVVGLEYHLGLETGLPSPEVLVPAPSTSPAGKTSASASASAAATQCLLLLPQPLLAPTQIRSLVKERRRSFTSIIFLRLQEARLRTFRFLLNSLTSSMSFVTMPNLRKKSCSPSWESESHRRSFCKLKKKSNFSLFIIPARFPAKPKTFLAAEPIKTNFCWRTISKFEFFGCPPPILSKGCYQLQGD